MNLKKWIGLATLAVCSMGFQSCLDDDNEMSVVLPNALVTVKPTSENSFYLQLDDSTTLLPTNLTSSPFGSKEVRALTNFTEVNEPSDGYTKAVVINWIDSILTKNIAPDLGLDNDSVYGNDPVEIVGDWVTIAEDGYLTLRFRTPNSEMGKRHFVNLLYSNNPEKPYEVEFRHNAFGDTYGNMRDGLVAFRLDQLPDTNGEIVKLKLKWNSYSGERTAEFPYCTRKSTPAKAAISAERCSLKLK